MATHECIQVENIKEIRHQQEKLFGLSLPSWARTLLVGGIIALFVMYAGLWVYATDTFASKEDLECTQNKVDNVQKGIQKTLAEILHAVKK